MDKVNEGGGMNYLIVSTCAILFFGSVVTDVKAGGKKMVIEKGRKVSFDYTLKVDGKVVDSSKERGPFQYIQGEGKIIKGLSKRMEGLTIGEERDFSIPPEEAYGEVNPQAFYEIPKESLPKEIIPKPGTMLQMRTPDGHILPVRISQVKDKSVVLDLNHPLAGKTLQFHIKIVDIQ